MEIVFKTKIIPIRDKVEGRLYMDWVGGTQESVNDRFRGSITHVKLFVVCRTEASKLKRMNQILLGRIWLRLAGEADIYVLRGWRGEAGWFVEFGETVATKGGCLWEFGLIQIQIV